MSYESCGNTKLEGEEILKRLAEYLHVSVKDLKTALEIALDVAHINKRNNP